MKPTPIVALDVSEIGRALRLVGQLGDSCGFYKIGSELFTSVGPAAIAALRAERKRVLLDLKFHDIPNTVRSACKAAHDAGVTLLTVHASGGERMLEAAVEGAGAGCGVLAVTVLTSLDAGELESATGRPGPLVHEEVRRLAALARSAGAHGVVCSGHEVAGLQAEFGSNLAFLVPGIRLPGGPAHDQSRIVTPRAAAEAGATYLVIGRAVTAAADPVRAMREVLHDLSAAGLAEDP